MRTHYFSLYLAQNGHTLTCVVDQSKADQIHTLIDSGVAFGVYMDQKQFNPDGSELRRNTGLIVNPRQGGLLVSMSSALRIPLDKNGQPAQTQAAVHRWLEPDEQVQGEIVVPGWADRAALELPHNQPPSEPPPTPPGPRRKSENGIAT